MIQMELAVEEVNISAESTEDDENIQMEIEEIFEKEVSGTNDYEKLKNLPKLNGEIIMGDMAESDPTVPAWAKKAVKPTYIPEEIGALSEENEVSLQEISTWFN